MTDSAPSPSPDAAPAPEPAPTPAPEAAAKSLETLLEEAQAKVEEQRNAWLRALADAENARKRAQSDIAAAGKFAVERFVQDLLPVADSLEAALAAPAAEGDPVRAGVELTLRQLKAALEKAKVTEIVATPGEKFDPNRHQAMAAVEAEGEPNTVVTVLQRGYLLHERVVRPALVTVAKPKDPGSAG